MTNTHDNAARIGAITSSITSLAVDAIGLCEDSAHYLLAIEIMAEEARRLAEGIEKREMAKRRDSGNGAYLHLETAAQ